MKKKNFLFLILITVLFFAGIDKTFAKQCKTKDCEEEIEDFKYEKESENLKMVCSYAVKHADKNEYYATAIFYDINEKLFYVQTNNGVSYGQLSSGNYPRYALGGSYSVLKDMNRCPRYSYVDFKNNNEVCFDSDGTSCNSYTKTRNNYGPKENSTIVDDKVSEYKGYDNTFKGSCNKDNELAKQYGGFCRYIDSNANYILVYYNDKSSTVVEYTAKTNEFHTFVAGEKLFGEHYGDTNFFSDDNIWVYQNNIYGLTSCPNELHVTEIYNIIDAANKITYRHIISANKLSQEEIDDEISEYILGNMKFLYKTTDSTDFKLNQCPNNSQSTTKPEKKGCELIPSKIIEYIDEVMSYIRIAVPILLGGLIVFDFASAMFAGNEDKMKKAQGKAIKRIIIAIVIFFVPTLINLVFNIVNDVWSNANFEICGLDK